VRGEGKFTVEEDAEEFDFCGNRNRGAIECKVGVRRTRVGSSKKNTMRFGGGKFETITIAPGLNFIDAFLYDRFGFINGGGTDINGKIIDEKGALDVGVDVLNNAVNTEAK
jgi:hypothetical protein